MSKGRRWLVAWSRALREEWIFAITPGHFTGRTLMKRAIALIERGSPSGAGRKNFSCHFFAALILAFFQAAARKMSVFSRECA